MPQRRGPAVLQYMETGHFALRPVCVHPAARFGDDDAVRLCADPPAGSIGDVPLCARHLELMLTWREEITEEQREQFTAERRQRELARVDDEAAYQKQLEGRRRELALIYYLRRGDGDIKIGTTWRLKTRMASLQREHGPLQLLLTHSGGRHQESGLHQRFAELRVGGEWFTARKRLTDWIRKCRLDPVMAATQAPGTVDMDAIRLLCRDGNAASQALGRARMRHSMDELERVKRDLAAGLIPPLRPTADISA